MLVWLTPPLRTFPHGSYSCWLAIAPLLVLALTLPSPFDRSYELGETILRITQWLLPLERS